MVFFLLLFLLLFSFEYALKIDPNFSLAWFNKGVSLDNLGN